MTQPAITDPEATTTPTIIDPEATTQLTITGLEATTQLTITGLEATTQPAITGLEAMTQPAIISPFSDDDINVTISPPVTLDAVVAGYSKEAGTFTVATHTLKEGPQPPFQPLSSPLQPPSSPLQPPSSPLQSPSSPLQPPSSPLQPPSSPLQPPSHFTSLPSPNTVKKNQPIISLERLSEDTFRREKKEHREEKEEGALNVKHPQRQVLKEAMHEMDSALASSKLAAQPDALKRGQEESAVGPVKSSQSRAHSEKLEMIVLRLRDQASAELTLSEWLTPRVEPVEVVHIKEDSPTFLEGQGQRDEPTDAGQVGESSCAAAEVAEEMEETSLESTSEEQREEDSSTSSPHAVSDTNIICSNWCESPLFHGVVLCSLKCL